jgi:hypothetical protein
MLGNSLTNSSGPPDYKPIWVHHDEWTFSSQYFMEINNTKTGNPAEGHAATGEMYECKEGEKLWTKFSLSDDHVWSESRHTTRISDVFSRRFADMPELAISSGHGGRRRRVAYVDCGCGQAVHGPGPREHDELGGGGVLSMPRQHLLGAVRCDRRRPLSFERCAAQLHFFVESVAVALMQSALLLYPESSSRSTSWVRLRVCSVQVPSTTYPSRRRPRMRSRGTRTGTRCWRTAIARTPPSLRRTTIPHRM